MRVVTSINGLLRTLSTAQTRFGVDARCVSTGLAELDALAPGGGFALGAIHEVIGDDMSEYQKFFAENPK